MSAVDDRMTRHEEDPTTTTTHVVDVAAVTSINNINKMGTSLSAVKSSKSRNQWPPPTTSTSTNMSRSPLTMASSFISTTSSLTSQPAPVRLLCNLPPDLLRRHFMPFISPDDELSLSLCSKALRDIVEESLQAGLGEIISREYCYHSTKDLHLQQLRLSELQLRAKAKLGKPRMPFRLLVRGLARGLALYCSHSTSHQERSSPLAVCGSSDGTTVVALYGNGQQSQRLLICSCRNPPGFESVELYTHGLPTLTRKNSRLWQCKLDGYTYIVLHVKHGRAAALGPGTESMMCCWSWDGTSTALNLVFTKEFVDPLTNESTPFSMAVAEDGMIYYVDKRDNRLHAVNLLDYDHPDSSHVSVPCGLMGGGCPGHLDGSYTAIVGDYVLLTGLKLYALRRDTLEVCHVFPYWSWPELYSPSAGAVTMNGSFHTDKFGFHSLSVDSTGTIEYGCHLRPPYGNSYWYRIRSSWGSLVYAHDAHEDQDVNRLHVFDIDSGGRCIRTLDGHGVAELVATNKGVFLFMDHGEIQFHIDCAVIQCYYFV